MPTAELLKAIERDPLVSQEDKEWFRRTLVTGRAPASPKRVPRAAPLRRAPG